MSKPGNYTAYQQYKPLDNGTTQALQHWSNFAEQKRQNDIANEQRDRQLKNQKEKDDREWVDGLLKQEPIKATGISSVDELNAIIAFKTRQERLRLVGEMIQEKPGSLGYLQKKSLLESNDLIPKEINGIKNQILENAKKYAEGRDTSFTVDPYLDDFYKNVENSEIVIDPKTQKVVVLIQDPEDPTKKISFTHQDVMNGKGDFKLTPKFNIQTMAKESAKLLNAKPNSEDRIDPATGYLLTEEGFDQPTIEQLAKNTFSDQDGKPTEAAISLSKQQGIYNLEEISSPENLAKLEAQFIKEIDPLMISKNKIKTNTIELQRKKNETDAAYKNRMAGVAEKNANTKVEIGVGSGKIQKPVSMTDFVQGTIPRADGKVLFNVKNNALIVNYGKGENEMQRNVTGVIINPNDPNDITINYIESGKRLNGRRIEPYNEPKSYNSKTDGEMTGTFSAEFGSTLKELNASLKNKAGIKEKPKPKPTSKAKAKPSETLEERKKRLGLK